MAIKKAIKESWKKDGGEDLRPLPLLIFGAAGRMGQALLLAAESDARITEVLATFSPRQRAMEQGSDGNTFKLSALRDFGKSREVADAETAIRAVAAGGGAAIDFTPPRAALSHALLAKSQGCPFVCGTTGFSDSEMLELRSAGQGCALVYASNFSLCIALLSSLVERAASDLPSSRFDAEIMEMHHRAKCDAPSGTALRLGEAIGKGRGTTSLQERRGARSGARVSGEVGYGVLRGGGIVGEHRVMFAGEGERLTLSHECFSRTIFAEGAISSALWSLDRCSGFYSINDVLNII